MNPIARLDRRMEQRIAKSGMGHTNIEAALRIIVGHEIIRDQDGPIAQYQAASKQHININDFI